MDEDGLMMNWMAPQPMVAARPTSNSAPTRKRKRVNSSVSLKDIRDGSWSKQQQALFKQKQKQKYAANAGTPAAAAPTAPAAPTIPNTNTSAIISTTKPLIGVGATVLSPPSHAVHPASPPNSKLDESAPKRRKISDPSTHTPTSVPALPPPAEKTAAPPAAAISAALPPADAPKQDNVALINAAKSDIPRRPAVQLFSEGATFDQFGLEEHLLDNLKGYMQLERPTAVQAASFSELLSDDRDAFIKAPTGSGKTLAYLVPIVQQLLSSEKRVERADGTLALVIAPTRELCIQIYEVLRKLLRPFPYIVPGVIMGGEKRKSEKARLRKGVTILVTTPGRLLDHLRHTNSFQLPNIRFLVFDEADRLLDMGFEQDIRQMFTILQSKSEGSRSRTFLCSATLNDQVGRLVNLSLQNPIFINPAPAPKQPKPQAKQPSQPENTPTGDIDDIEVVPVENPDSDMDVGSEEEDEPAGPDAADEELERAHEIPAQLRQHFTICHSKRKLTTLSAFLRWKIVTEPDAKIIVFLSNCDSVEYFYALFSAVEIPKGSLQARRRAYRAGEPPETESLLPCNLFKLHGNLSQQVRSSTYAAFNKAEKGILFATDVAARGIDVPRVSWIVQYDVPSDPAAYIHRIGRTARIGSQGDALLMVIESELPYVDILRARKQMQLAELPADQILSNLKTNIEANSREDPAREASALQHLMEQIVSASSQFDFRTMAVKAYQSYLRSYATHSKATKHIFHIKNIHLGHLARNFALTDPPSKFKEMLAAQEDEKGKKKDKSKGRNLRVYRTESPTSIIPGQGSFAAKFLGKQKAGAKGAVRRALPRFDMSAEFASGI